MKDLKAICHDSIFGNTLCNYMNTYMQFNDGILAISVLLSIFSVINGFLANKIINTMDRKKSLFSDMSNLTEDYNS